MQRGGMTHQPFYRIVAAHGTRKRDGDYIERIGSYNALTTPPKLVIDEPKALKWLLQGAQPSDTVKSLLRKTGILHKWRLTAKGLAADQIQAEMDKWNAAQAQRVAQKRTKKTRALKKKFEKPADKPVEKTAEKPVEASTTESAPAVQ
jgi:small subunit ribosomal protein S16